MFKLRNLIEFQKKFNLIRNVSTVSLPQQNQQIESQLNDDDSLPLLDTFGRKHDYLRISLTERCNLRCLYCMPEEGVQLTPKSNLLTNDEIYRLSKLFVQNFGIKKIRLTGGEPLIRKDIVDIVENLSSLKNQSNNPPNKCNLEKISMTTNGIVFSKYCKLLHQAGLDSVNISLDTLNRERFKFMTRRDGLNKVLKSIDSALEENFDSLKINFVPIKGINDDEIENFILMTKKSNIQIRFIEFMPFMGNQWKIDKMLSYQTLLDRIKKNFNIQRIESSSKNETAILYKIPGHLGTIGFINSITKPFCSGCNRIRLTADGHLKVCLFGKEEISLKNSIRNGLNDQELMNLIQTSIRKKKKQHGGNEIISNLNSNTNNNRPMILIDQKRYFSSKKSDLDDIIIDGDNNSNFSHIDLKNGQAKMIDIGQKSPTLRIAKAQATIHLGKDLMEKIESNQIAKGNVLNVAKISAIMAAKSTSSLIPFCHQISLDYIDIKFQFNYKNEDIIIETKCQTFNKTGVEMEALIAASIGALTIYDMCKSLNKSICIKNCHLIYKKGGKSGDYYYDENDKMINKMITEEGKEVK